MQDDERVYLCLHHWQRHVDDSNYQGHWVLAYEDVPDELLRPSYLTLRGMMISHIGLLHEVRHKYQNMVVRTISKSRKGPIHHQEKNDYLI